MNNIRQHNDGPTWTVSADIIREFNHIAANGGYVFLSDDMQLWETQHSNEYDHIRYNHRYCS
jgi:hypothetical protein